MTLKKHKGLMCRSAQGRLSNANAGCYSGDVLTYTGYKIQVSQAAYNLRHTSSLFIARVEATLSK